LSVVINCTDLNDLTVRSGSRFGTDGHSVVFRQAKALSMRHA
jgi:hypothetical protein